MSESDLGSQPPTPLPEAGHAAGDEDRSMSEEQESPPAAVRPLKRTMKTCLSDNESELSEVDEDEFANFDPTTIALEDRPLVDIMRMLHVHLRRLRERRLVMARKESKGGQAREEEETSQR